MADADKTPVPKFSSTYGLLDVEKGRKKLRKHLENRGPVKVMIEATLEYPFGSDDGTSIEFVMHVSSVMVKG